MEIILGQARRRWSEDEKRALVAETLVQGETVHGVARRHNISRSMLFCWRKQYREPPGLAAPTSAPMGFTPVAIAGPEPGTPSTIARSFRSAMEDGYESSSSRRRRARAQAMPGAGEPSLSKSLEAKIPFQMREQQLAGSVTLRNR